MTAPVRGPSDPAAVPSRTGALLVTTAPRVA